MPERGIVEGEQVRQVRRRQFRPRDKRLVRRRAVGKLVPRTDGEAIITAINPVADCDTKFMRDRPLVLDCQIGNAPPRIETVGGGEGLGGTGPLPSRCAAMHFLPDNRAQGADPA